MFLMINIIALLVGIANAQTSTVSLMLLDTDPQTLVASVISANPSTTEYLVGCPTGTDANECGYHPPMTVKHAGSVYGASITNADLQFTMSWECTVKTSSGTTAACITSAGGQQANFPGKTTETISGTDVSFLPVTVSAGVNLLAKETGSSESTGFKSTGSSLATGAQNSALTARVGLGLASLAVIAIAL